MNYRSLLKDSMLSLVTLIILLFSCMGCKKYLDEKSDSLLVTPSTVKDYQAILDDAVVMNFGNTPGLGESSSDDFFLTQDIYDQVTTEEQNIYTWQTGDYFYGSGWSDGYRGVYNSNLCLDGLNLIPRDSNNEQAWNNVYGSALFFRAFNFYNLASEYATAYDPTTATSDLGIVLRLGSSPDVPSNRSSVENTYRQILLDAKRAAEYLPDNPEHVVRPSKAAAFGLLARVYLAMNQYDSGFKYSNLCLAIKNNLIDYNGSDPISRRFNAETIFYTEMNSYVTLFSPDYAFVDSLLVKQYADDDLRKERFLSPIDDHYSFAGSYTNATSTLFTGLATDEIYLIRAESSVRLGQVSAGMNDLNSLLAKRYRTGTFMPLAANTAAEAVALILQERRKEILYRGLRWMDIKRLNKAGAQITLTRLVDGHIVSLPPNDKRYALPLPADIIRITGMQQN